MATESYTGKYTTFSGSDIVATMAGQAVGTLQSITWSVTREKVPVYTMGSPDPRSFSRGKRGIAGSAVFTTFDRDALSFLYKEEDLNKFVTAYANTSDTDQGTSTTRILSASEWDELMTDVWETNNVLFRRSTAFYADQLRPFDIVITMQNEYGNAATMSILGCEILNEGSGMSVDDGTTEKAATFVARGIKPLRPITAGLEGTAVR